MAKIKNRTLVCRIPIEPRIVESGDNGRPFILDQPNSEAAHAFNDIVEKIIFQLKEEV